MAHQAIPEEEPPDPQPDFMKFCKKNFPSEPGRFPVLYYDQELLTKYVVEVQNPSIVPTAMLLCRKTNSTAIFQTNYYIWEITSDSLHDLYGSQRTKLLQIQFFLMYSMS